MSRALYIVNPTACGGAGPSAWKKFVATAGEPDPADVVFTEHTGHASDIAVKAEGVDIIVAAGGDGTACEVLTGLMSRPEPRPRFAVIPCGTGNDMARNVGICSIEDAVSALRGGKTRRVDLFRVDFTDGDKRAYRYACLGSNVGFAAVSFKMLRPWMKRLLGPKIAYYCSIILGTAVHRPPKVKISWDTGEYAGRIWMMVIGNVERTAGGSWCIAPGASIDDGRIHVTIVPALFRGRVLARMPQIADGSHVKDPNIQYFPTDQVTVESASPSELVIDGDVLGTTPVTYTACPSAVEVMSVSDGSE